LPPVPVKPAMPVPSIPTPPPPQKPASHSPSNPAEPESERDKTGLPIPDTILPLWREAQRVQTLLTDLSSVRGFIRNAQEEDRKEWAEVNFSSVQAQLDQAYTEIKTVKPFAVCPTCQGLNPSNCRLCKGRGFISEFRWGTVPQETKEIRFKARK
jgi:hypothetical protein